VRDAGLAAVGGKGKESREAKGKGYLQERFPKDAYPRGKRFGKDRRGEISGFQKGTGYEYDPNI